MPGREGYSGLSRDDGSTELGSTEYTTRHMFHSAGTVQTTPITYPGSYEGCQTMTTIPKGNQIPGPDDGRPDSPDSLMGYTTDISKASSSPIVGFSDSDFASNPEDRKSIGAYILHDISKSSSSPIVGFRDSDFAINPEDRKSIGSYILYFMGSPIDWKSKKMSMTCLSTMEAELVAMTEATTQMMNVRNLLTDLMFPPEGPSILKCDNQSSIVFSKNSEENTHTKHIDYRRFL
eukprot:CAMPEP_0184328666 /NCGR_PEP_ID=MMETSP1049-20130417/143743_1 /TAXON_ID=77928 /ORGANISM="Proteomonas sulcata, Strain CCMP704" /LENGTH=233 /DNA_ID=CAMNT_0026650991 /DNA_START=152 /DNA_END=854 /DNA_ORIENTATION=+